MTRMLPLLSSLAFAACACAAGAWNITPRNDEDTLEHDDSDKVLDWHKGETDTNHIDVLIVFDASARHWLETSGQTSLEFAKFCIDDMNSSLSYTGISRHFTFRLAGVEDLSPLNLSSYELRDIVASFSPALSAKRLDGNIVGTVRKSRDKHFADIVAFLTIGKSQTRYGESNGLAADDFTPEEMYNCAEKAYCAVKIDAIASRHVLLHEIGHIFGAGHSDAQQIAPGPQLFPHSAAYRFSAGDTSLTTIVGYPEIKDGPIMPFFSSPNHALTYTDDNGKTHTNIRIGTPTNDNTRTIIATYPLVSQYRARKPSDALIRFNDGVQFQLEENGVPIATGDKALKLRCGVRRTFKLKWNAPGEASMKAKHLPVGFKYDSESKAITGKATKPGTYTSVFSFDDGLTGLTVRRYVTFDIEPLPKWAIGTFEASDGKRQIRISEKGTITITSRYLNNNGRIAQDGFAGEDTDANGHAVFLLDDGSKLKFDSDSKGQELSVVIGSDGTRHNRFQNKPKRKIKQRKHSAR